MSGPKTPYSDILRRVSDTPNEGRFADIRTRRDESVISKHTWKYLAVEHAYDQRWKNTLLNKGPTEIAAYPMLLHELKPNTVIELGSLNGGGAIWMADICSIFGLSPKFISIDLDLGMLSGEARTDTRIQFIEADVNCIEQIDALKNSDAMRHPWLIIDDCHVNTIGILEFFEHCGAAHGDYIIIEDTNLDAWDAWADDWMDASRVSNGKQKIIQMREWLELNPMWKVDTKYTDLFGYNATKNWNSVLRKISAWKDV